MDGVELYDYHRRHVCISNLRVCGIACRLDARSHVSLAPVTLSLILLSKFKRQA